MAINIAAALTNTLMSAGLPVMGVSIGSPTDKTTWRVDWTQTPTSGQLTQAADIMTTFDPTNQATIDSDRLTLATASSRQKDKLADIAWVVRRSNLTAWGNLTLAQKKAQVLAEANDWRDLRVWIEQNL